jgi:hypothetical protein
MTGPFQEVRGTAFPDSPRNNQLFFMDVPNGSTPARGWYIARVGFAGGADWTYLALALSDRGDLVRPSESLRPNGPHR